MSFSIVVVLAALGLAGVAALALRRPRESWLVGPPVACGRWRPVGAGDVVRAVAGLVGFWAGGAGRAPGPRVAPAPPAEPRVPVIGYATFSDRGGQAVAMTSSARQAGVIARACDRRGLVLVEMVGDPHHDRRAGARRRLSEARPGLRYALGQIAAGDARGLVVPGLRRLTRSVAELGPIVEWCPAPRGAAGGRGARV